MIEPVVLNKNFEALAVIDDYASFIWTMRYYKCGDFEIVVPVTEKYVELMQIGYYIRRDDDENVGIIEDFEISRSDLLYGLGDRVFLSMRRLFLYPLRGGQQFHIRKANGYLTFSFSYYITKIKYNIPVFHKQPPVFCVIWGIGEGILLPSNLMIK